MNGTRYKEKKCWATVKVFKAVLATDGCCIRSCKGGEGIHASNGSKAPQKNIRKS
jgi:hypothetical protein